MRIKRFTPRATELFSLIEREIGRSVAGHHGTGSTIPLLEDDADRVFETLRPVEREVTSRRPAHFPGADAAVSHARGPDRGRGADVRRHHARVRKARSADVAQAASRLLVAAETTRDFAIITMDRSAASSQAGTRRRAHVRLCEAERPSVNPAALIFTPEDRAEGAPEAELRRARETAAPRTSAGICARTAALLLQRRHDAAVRARGYGYTKIAQRPDRAQAPRSERSERLLAQEQAVRARGGSGRPAEGRVPGGDVARAEAAAQPRCR